MVPVTLLFLLWAPDEILRPWSRVFLEGKLLMILTGLPLLAGWRLMIAFWRRGASALRETHALVWAAATIGALSAIVASGLFWMTNGERMPGSFGIAAFGAPLLVPFIHLVVERWRPVV